jgi:hypothetical protein
MAAKRLSTPPIYILPDLASDNLPDSGNMYGIKSGKM